MKISNRPQARLQCLAIASVLACTLAMAAPWQADKSALVGQGDVADVDDLLAFQDESSAAAAASSNGNELASNQDDQSEADADSADEGDADDDDQAPKRAASGSLAAYHNSLFGGHGEENVELEGEHIRGLDTNIANAKVSLDGSDMQPAAGHHHHHKHHVHGKMEMGAHTGKKGAFGWHSKHPVGGKGR